jgi:hypothetical protein
MANFNIFTFNINDLNRVNVQQLFQQDIEADVQVQPSQAPTVPTCRHCHLEGHQRTSSRHCLANPRNIQNQSDVRRLDNEIATDLTSPTLAIQNETSQPANPESERNVRRRIERATFYNVARGLQNIPAERHDAGKMDIECPYCHAKMWLEERISNTSKINPKFGMCCNKGKYTIEELKPTHPVIRELLSGNTSESREFKSNIRVYNSKFNFTSLGVTFDKSVMRSGGTFTFRIHGSIYHNIGSLLPGTPHTVPVAAQVYVVDPAYQNNIRSGNGSVLHEPTVASVQQLLHEINTYASEFVRMSDAVRNSGGSEDVTMVFKADGVPDRRTYNAPTTTEIGMVYINSESSDVGPRDIVIRTRSNEVRRVSELNQHYDPLHYVMMFPEGDFFIRVFELKVWLIKRLHIFFLLFLCKRPSRMDSFYVFSYSPC